MIAVTPPPPPRGLAKRSREAMCYMLLLLAVFNLGHSWVSDRGAECPLPPLGAHPNNTWPITKSDCRFTCLTLDVSPVCLSMEDKPGAGVMCCGWPFAIQFLRLTTSVLAGVTAFTTLHHNARTEAPMAPVMRSFLCGAMIATTALLGKDFVTASEAGCPNWAKRTGRPDWSPEVRDYTDPLGVKLQCEGAHTEIRTDLLVDLSTVMLWMVMTAVVHVAGLERGGRVTVAPGAPRRPRLAATPGGHLPLEREGYGRARTPEAEAGERPQSAAESGSSSPSPNSSRSAMATSRSSSTPPNPNSPRTTSLEAALSSMGRRGL